MAVKAKGGINKSGWMPGSPKKSLVLFDVKKGAFRRVQKPRKNF